MLDPESSLIQMGAARVVAGADKYADAAGAAHYIVARVTEAHHAISEVTTFGLFPLALVLFAAHENHRALSEGSPFRTRYFVIRTLSVFVAILCYGKICSLICSVCGSGGGFMKPDNFLKDASKSFDFMDAAMQRLGGGDSWTGDVKALGKFIGLIMVWLLTMVCALFAHVANLLLAKSQGLLILILVALGKGCIAASLCPGVGLGKSWARALAQVAFWSTVAGVINFGNILERRAGVYAYVAGADYGGLFMCAGQFIIIGIFTLSVPKISAAVFSGAAPGAVGVGAAMLLGAKGLMMAGQDAKSVGMGAAQGVKGSLDKARGKDGGNKGQRGLNKLDGDGGGSGSGGHRGGGGSGGGGSHAPLVQRATAAAVGMALWPLAKAGNAVRQGLAGKGAAPGGGSGEGAAGGGRVGGGALGAARGRASEAPGGDGGLDEGQSGPRGKQGSFWEGPIGERAAEIQQSLPKLGDAYAHNLADTEDTVARMDSATSKAELDGIAGGFSKRHSELDPMSDAIDPSRGFREVVGEAAAANEARLTGGEIPHGRPKAAAEMRAVAILAGQDPRSPSLEPRLPFDNDHLASSRGSPAPDSGGGAREASTRAVASSGAPARVQDAPQPRSQFPDQSAPKAHNGHPNVVRRPDVNPQPLQRAAEKKGEN